MNTQDIDFYKFIATPAGRAALLAKAREYSQKYGGQWLATFKNDFPLAASIIDLSANYDAVTAFERLKDIVSKIIEGHFHGFFEREAAKLAALYALESNKNEIFQFHADLKSEIDRKQF